MKLVCKRLPATEDTLHAISPLFAMPHIQKYIDDYLRTYYGVWKLFDGFLSGKFRIYGVFDLDDGVRLLGIEWGHLAGKDFEHHALWCRHTPTVECVTMCKETMKAEFAAEGVNVKYAVGFIPDFNRAANYMALRAGCTDLGLREDKIFYKNGKKFPCREFRIKL